MDQNQTNQVLYLLNKAIATLNTDDPPQLTRKANAIAAIDEARTIIKRNS